MAFIPIFARIAAISAAAIKEAMQWFSSSVKRLVSGDEEVLDQEHEIKKAVDEKLFKLADSIEIGKMYLFKYDAKTKAKLPYWDEFPLMIPIGYFDGGFMGINFHYLPTDARVNFLNALMNLSIDDKYDEDEKLDISYDILRSYGTLFSALYTDCIKKYLYSHVRSRFNYVSPKDWGHVAAMPFERWHYRK
jgi:hypothetical protein